MDSSAESKHSFVSHIAAADEMKLSPERSSVKSCSTSSSSSAVGGSEKKMPFLIGVAGGTASGKVVLIFLYFSTPGV